MLRAFLLIAAAIPAVAELRTWTDNTGRRQVSAALVDAKGDRVYLRNGTGKIYEVPSDRLSVGDREYVRRLYPFQSLAGEVIGLADGDTITLLDATRTQHKVRLEGIDAPERKQDFGTQSRRALAKKLFRKSVRVEWKEKDRYGRPLGHVILDGRWINREQVAEGWAWHYKHFYKSAVLADAESNARLARLGLWQKPNSTAPWEFRNPTLAARGPPAAGLTTGHSLSNSTDSEESVVAASASNATIVYATESGNRYHKADCRYVTKSSIPITFADAEGIYTPCKVCHPELRRIVSTPERPPREPKPRRLYNRPRYYPSGRDLWGGRVGGSTQVMGGAPSGGGGTVNVRGHYRSDGTYVRPHTRRAAKPLKIHAGGSSEPPATENPQS